MHWNASNPFRMIRICIRMLQIPFEWLEFELESLELLSNASNPFRTVRICIQMLQIPFEWFEFDLECFE